MWLYLSQPPISTCKERARAAKRNSKDYWRTNTQCSHWNLSLPTITTVNISLDCQIYQSWITCKEEYQLKITHRATFILMGRSMCIHVVNTRIRTHIKTLDWHLLSHRRKGSDRQIGHNAGNSTLRRLAHLSLRMADIIRPRLAREYRRNHRTGLLWIEETNHLAPRPCSSQFTTCRA